ncbi:MAG TPA: hypothetical protein VHI77_07490 [Solirubrobacterales bacterium]|nr:hypothetical protein [Solirubrobacterales bacterium]
MSPDIKSAIAYSYVEPRGAVRGVVAKTVGREVLGAVGGAIGGMASRTEDKSPVEAGGIAFLAVFPEEVIVLRGKRGAFKPKPTEEVIASVPRSSVASAQLDRKAVKGILSVDFGDGNRWEFDLPRAHLKAADSVVKALG